MRKRLAIWRTVVAAALLPVCTGNAQQLIITRGGDAEAPRNNREPKPEASPAPPATLRWNNGESLTGEAIGATNDALAWKSPLFDDPLELAWTLLHRIDKPSSGSAPNDPFAFVLRDGSRVYGDLLGLTDATLKIRSSRHGDAVLRRSEVIGAWRTKGHRVVYAGPWGESGWTPTPGVQTESENTGMSETLGRVPTRLTGPGGALVLPYWRRALSNALTLPDRAEVEFRLHATDQPAFQLVLDGRGKKRLRVETWGDEVVLATSMGFEKICQLGEKDRSVALRVCWDRPARRCQVYTPAGVLLKEWTVPEGNEGGRPAVILANKGRDLTLDFLRIREWDGRPPAASDIGHPRVELDDGRVVAGDAREIGADGVTIAQPGEGSAVRVPFADVDALILSDGATWTDLRETTLTCADGTFLRGRICGYENKRALVKTSFTEEPLPVKIDDLRQLVVRAASPAEISSEPPLESLDKITVQGTTLHGRLVAVADGDSPRWMPVGGKNAAAPARSAVSEITRFFPTGAKETPAASLLYTRMGDALPGVLHGLDREEIDFDSPWIDAKKLPVEELQGIHFDTADQEAVPGFDAAGWQVIKGDQSAIRKDHAAVRLTPGSVVGHPSAAQDGELMFTYDTESYSCLRVRLFCDGTNPAHSLNYMFMRSGNRINSGVEVAEGQFNAQRPASAIDGPVPVRFVIDEKSVRVYIGDTLSDIVWYPVAKRTGAGLVLEPAGFWGNPAQEVVLSKFNASSPSSRNFVVNVSAEARTQALTVPRFRRDDPPRHALLAANGDVLRGEVVAVTDTQIGLRIGLETLRIPRDRVAAMIALQPPAPALPAPVETDAVQKLLERRVELQNWYSNVGYVSLLNVIQQSVPEFKFQTPSEQDSQAVQFRFDNQSVGDVLDGVCAQFELHYHVEKGVFVFETRGGKPAANMVRRAYWLKTNPFAGHGSAVEVFAAKDVPFPKGASVEWQEGSRCLEVTNTDANQKKIARLLASDLGGMLGSPTHWLTLRNGGRIGLVVEKFEPDAIRGTHPIYGRCRIPFADVYAVRNTLPETKAAARAFSGWQTVYAPEPVLPQSGGENSDLLGKDAPTFKVPTLAREDFDLGRQRGSVVVLEFWATWCAPCIKSMPGLIDTMSHFPAEKVKLIAVNRAEALEPVKRFVESHQWNLTVAMDAGESVAKQYGVDGIPFTVVIGPDGKVAWVQTGYDPDEDEKLGEAVKKLLGGGTVAPRETPKGSTEADNHTPR